MISKTNHYRFILGMFLLVLMSQQVFAQAIPDMIQRLPAFAWEERSDWLNVKSDVTPRAVGDGIADDTAAIQAALTATKNGGTLYFPAGTYRITKTLLIQGPIVSALYVGDGRATRLVWDGEKGGVLLNANGVAYCRFVGIVLDGRNRAAVGILHESDARFETENRHQHMGFIGFTDSGLLASPKAKFALAEVSFENCLFDTCHRGVAFLNFNDYDYTFDGCEFRNCDIGIECQHGNFYARNCHFEGSREVDILSAPEHASSIRRCTSYGSKSFLNFVQSVAPMTIQDCQVGAWKDPAGAMVLCGAPVMLFDCVFSDRPANAPPPIRLLRDGQRLVTSGNIVRGSTAVFQPGRQSVVFDVPEVQYRGALTSPRQSFLKSAVAIPTRVFDARRDFGAKGDGVTDDTAALQNTIDAARQYGKKAIAYFPTGNYIIRDTLRITGSDYFVGGTGMLTRLIWKGAEGGTMVEIADPQNITLEQISVGHSDAGKMNHAIDIHQQGSAQPTRMIYDGVFVYGLYQRQPWRQGLHLTNLDSDDLVIMPHVQGNIRVIDSARATILGNMTYEGSIVVEGKDIRRDGLLGFFTRLCTLTTHGLYVKDNHSIIMSDFYVEQSNNGFVCEGSPGDPPGRVTIQGAKVDFTNSTEQGGGTALQINNYQGQICIGPDQFYVNPPLARIRQTGERPVDLCLMANFFYNSKLDLQQQGALTLHLVSNEARSIIGNPNIAPMESNVAEALHPTTRELVKNVLDDLRRLGTADLRVNYPEQARP